ncbi:HAMP domain-containing protein [Senna tora]|uniref:HAMP domain-containing protein n=1 Tax=Senna tora TaxID=362788 RepID=A0A834SE07_9FABA|nr:HAMP domain-containing protein [Senna tora]
MTQQRSCDEGSNRGEAERKFFKIDLTKLGRSNASLSLSTEAIALTLHSPLSTHRSRSHSPLQFSESMAERAREQAERAREQAERAREQAERAREQAERAREQAERARVRAGGASSCVRAGGASS